MSIEEQTQNAAREEKTPFLYIHSSLTSNNDEQYDGCSCSSTDTCTNCPCTHRFGRNYDSSQCLLKDKINPIFECNSECQCSLETCENRVSQKDDRSNDVQLISTPGKGFGIITRQALPHSGMYIGEYVGEVLTDIDARMRMKANEHAEHNYLLLYNEHHGETTIQTFIDARYYGNWTRFINHSCHPNLHIVPIRIDRFTPPHLAFFTLRSIEINEELSYSYGTHIDPIHSKVCHCTSSICTGFLPYQQSD